MGDTSIEWTRGDDGTSGNTWNPVAGCSVVSPGCHRCYARNIAARFSGPGLPYHGLAIMTEHGPQWTGEMRLVHEHLADPLRWRKPHRIFVNSMSDLFAEGLTNEEIAAVFGVMAACPQHTFQILTKRSKRMREWFEWVASASPASGTGERTPESVCNNAAVWATTVDEMFPDALAGYRRTWPLSNAWLGVSVEDQKRADERIPELLRTPAAVRFVSYEPALGPVDFTTIVERIAGVDVIRDALRPNALSVIDPAQGRRLDWIIVGGESGPGARPFDVAWARSTVQQCGAARVACFVKQFGADPIDTSLIETEMLTAPDGRVAFSPRHTGHVRLKSRKGNDMDEWPRDLRVRQFPEARS